MKRIVFLLICLTCACLGFATKAALENEVIAQTLRDYGVWISIFVIAGLLALGIGLALAYVIIRHRLRKLLNADGPMTEAEIAAGLVDALTSPQGVSDPTPEDRQRAALVNAGTWFMRRQATQFYFNVTVTVMGGLIGAATLFLLYEQNEKIDEQTRRITLQTDANVTQSVLLEGTRRAASAQELNILLGDIRTARATNTRECSDGNDTDCWRWHNQEEDQRRRVLPPLLQQRAKAFAQRSTPYFTVAPKARNVEFDERLNAQINLPFQSPERGQLFQELGRNAFDVSSIDFGYAALDAAELPDIYMPGVNLGWADLRDVQMQRAHMPDSNMRDADLTGADFDGAFGPQTRFDNATLAFANLHDAYLIGAVMASGDLQGVRLNSADLLGARINDANLVGSDLRNANLMRVNFRDSDLSDAALGWAHISETDFRGAKQTGMTLITAWAWEDTPPLGLGPGLELQLCTHSSGMGRMSKPDTSACRSVVVSSDN